MSQQTWKASEYEKNARFVSDLGAPVLELLEPVPGERILDVGCGDGVLTKKIAAAGCPVVGLEPSPDFCRAARQLGLEVVESSAEEMTFSSEFDAVFSNAALHWMRDRPERVVRNIARALRPGGRFVAEMGGHGCVETIKAALIDELNRRGLDGERANPWYFPTPERYSAHLTGAGFDVPYIALIPRPTPLPDIMGWLTTFSHSFTALLPESERLPYLERVRDRIEPQLCDANGRWVADYVRLRFKALLSRRTAQP
jgi:SAM-dependent methyltransferase